MIIDAIGCVRVFDFGIAIDSKIGHEPFVGQIAGSLLYMLPEQVHGHMITPTADVWAIGVMLYEMLIGARFFSGGSIEELLLAIMHDVPSVPSARNL